MQRATKDTGMCPELILLQKLLVYRADNKHLPVNVLCKHECSSECEMVEVDDYRACVFSGNVHLCTRQECNKINEQGVCVITGIMYPGLISEDFVTGEPVYDEDRTEEASALTRVIRQYDKREHRLLGLGLLTNGEELKSARLSKYSVSEEEINEQLKASKAKRHKNPLSEANTVKIGMMFNDLVKRVSLTANEAIESAERSEKEFQRWYAKYQKECNEKGILLQWNEVYRNYVKNVQAFSPLTEEEKIVLSDEAKSMWIAFMNIKSTYKGYNEFYHFLVYVNVRAQGITGIMKQWPTQSLLNCVKQKRELATLCDFHGHPFHNKKMTRHESEFRVRIITVQKDPYLKRIVNSGLYLDPLL